MNPLPPQDLWTRLALLDARCAVTVYSSTDPVEGQFWTANARRRDNPARFIEVTGDSMLAALLRLLITAESQRFAE